MAFGQQQGPPATRQQLDELLELLERAGHDGFRDARGPMGFNQRQAGGRFTRDEAQAFIDELIAAEDAANEAPAPKLAVVQPPEVEEGLRPFSDQALANELRRRGWTVTRD